jgi:hypothetical protein
MRLRTLIVVAAIWAASLVGTGLLAQDRGPSTPTTAPAAVISGTDLGFRPNGRRDRDGRVMGELVVRINGKWMDTTTSSVIVH